MPCSDLTGTVGANPNPVWIAILAAQWLVTLPLAATLGRSPRRRPIALLFLVVSAASTLTGYDIRRWADVTTGIPDLSIMVGDVLVVVAVLAILDLVAVMTRPDSTTRRRFLVAKVLLAGSALCLIALFCVIPRRLDHPDFGCWQPRSTFVIGYQLLFQACLGTGFLAAGMLVRPRVRTAGSRLIRAALRVLLVGLACGLAYVAQRCWYVIAHGFALPYPLEGPRYGIVPVVLLESALALTAIGALVPALYRTGLFLRRLTYHHRLRPLWTVLAEAAPENVLGEPLSPLADVLRVRGVEGRLYRRTIEIRDAQWELAGFVSPAMAEAATVALHEAGPRPEDDASLATQALLLEIARGAKLAKLPHAGAPDSAPWSGGADLDTEARTLLAVHRYRTDGRVQAIARSVIQDEHERMASATP